MIVVDCSGEVKFLIISTFFADSSYEHLLTKVAGMFIDEIDLRMSPST